jgi:hypothetical protein
MSATHQGMCDAQAKELELLLDLFRENPEDFWRSNKDCATDWNEAKFLQAINDCRLIPRADPNTLSHIHRLMRLIPLYEIAQANPDPYDKREVHKAVLERAGWSNPERFFVPIQLQGGGREGLPFRRERTKSGATVRETPGSCGVEVQQVRPMSTRSGTVIAVVTNRSRPVKSPARFDRRRLSPSFLFLTAHGRLDRAGRKWCPGPQPRWLIALLHTELGRSPHLRDQCMRLRSSVAHDDPRPGIDIVGH